MAAYPNPIGNAAGAQYDFLADLPTNDVDLVKNPTNADLRREIRSLKTCLRLEIARSSAKVDRVIALLGFPKRTVRRLDQVPLESKDGNDVDAFALPVRTVEQMNDFERKLADVQFHNNVARAFKEEYSKSGFEGKRVAYLLIEKLFDRALLTQYSWTGSSKNKIKCSFWALREVNRFFYLIVKSADPTYTELQHDEFFKGILKRSEIRARRSSNSRLSAPKKRRAKIRDPHGFEEIQEVNVPNIKIDLSSDFMEKEIPFIDAAAAPH